MEILAGILIGFALFAVITGACLFVYFGKRVYRMLEWFEARQGANENVMPYVKSMAKLYETAHSFDPKKSEPAEEKKPEEKPKENNFWNDLAALEREAENLASGDYDNSEFDMLDYTRDIHERIAELKESTTPTR